MQTIKLKAIKVWIDGLGLEFLATAATILFRPGASLAGVTESSFAPATAEF